MLTSKPMIYTGNISEDDVPEDSYHPMVEKVVEYAKRKYSCTHYIKLEAEIAQLNNDEKTCILTGNGVGEFRIGQVNTGYYRLWTS